MSNLIPVHSLVKEFVNEVNDEPNTQEVARPTNR